MKTPIIALALATLIVTRMFFGLTVVADFDAWCLDHFC
jgi:hypothetical protein